MPLEYADFARYYEGHGLSVEQSRTHFAAFADLMECVARLFWEDGTAANPLGITLDDDTIAQASPVDWSEPVANTFNSAAVPDPAGKKEP